MSSFLMKGCHTAVLNISLHFLRSTEGEGFFAASHPVCMTFTLSSRTNSGAPICIPKRIASFSLAAELLASQLENATLLCAVRLFTEKCNYAR